MNGERQWEREREKDSGRDSKRLSLSLFYKDGGGKCVKETIEINMN